MKYIIKHGKQPESVKCFECPYCGCIFKTDKDSYRHSLIRNEENYYSRCPECNHTAYLKNRADYESIKTIEVGE